ncbi:MAG: 3-hydroxyacyl-CoA dehydrogenase NAD-binding domain-containing protein [Cyclobacteriaceae bacterium]|nr:3-hydroxyacyl-CoA dehydrogenase NAD-binding domain-containing protein [Cyclobacteriaceae bacterium]
MGITSIKSVGIAGAGTMGQGIAQVCAYSGYEVWLYDINEELIRNGINQIDRSLQSQMEKGKISSENKSTILNRIKPQPSLQSLRADLIIEAVVEKLDIKKELFSILEKVNQDTSILTTNTSSIPVTQIASVLNNPSRFAGLHFFNPAPVMKLVEVIRGAATTPETIAVLKQFSESLGKICVEAKDSPGFIVNRVARHYYVEALKLVEENVADIQTIDQLMRSCGFKLGPFELIDLIGVDTNFSVTTSIYNAFHQDPKFRPSRIQQQKVDAGHHGRKSGKGFYDYQ